MLCSVVLQELTICSAPYYYHIRTASYAPSFVETEEIVAQLRTPEIRKEKCMFLYLARLLLLLLVNTARLA